MKQRSIIRLWLFGIGVLVIWLWTGFDQSLHWDEPGYLYSAMFEDCEQIFQDAYEPSGIVGFNMSRVLHLLIIKAVAALVSPGMPSIISVMGLYLALLITTVWLSYRIMQILLPGEKLLEMAMLIAMFMPSVVYLLFKTTPDIPALFFSTVASWAFLRSLEDQKRWIVISAIALAAAGLTKYVIAWQYISLLLVLIVYGGWRFTIVHVVRHALIIGVMSLSIWGAVLWACKIDCRLFLEFLTVAAHSPEPMIAKLMHICFAGGLLFMALPCALLSRQWKYFCFFILWLIFATGPFLLIVPRLEVRFMAVGFIPLAGLVWLSLRGIRSLFTKKRRFIERSMLVVLFAVLAVTAVIIQPLTEHEVRMDEMHSLLTQVDATRGDSDVALITPWRYVDFHYLRVAEPQRDVYYVQDLTDVRTLASQGFQARFEMEGRLLRTIEDLQQLDKEMIYIGFHETFAVTNLRAYILRIPFTPLRKKLLSQFEKMDFIDHLQLGWMWGDQQIDMQEIVRVGHYRAFKVLLKSSYTTNEK